MSRHRKQDRDGLYRRKDSSVWWVSFTGADGARIRRSTGTTDRKEAEALLAKWKLESHQERHWNRGPERSFTEVMLAYLEGPGAAKRSADRDKLSAANLARHLRGRIMQNLSPGDILDYIQKRQSEGVAPATINRELSLLSTAINHARRDLEWDIPNPVQGRKLREPEGRVRWITREEAVRLIEAAENNPRAPHLADFIRLALHTGCRRGELLGLEWERVDLDRDLLYLEARHTKAKRRRSVPLNREARKALDARLAFRKKFCPKSPWVFCNRKGQRITDLKRSFSSACREAGIEDFRIHDLRHTCAAWLVSAGVQLAEVRDLLGHASITMTERYAHLAPENVRSAVARLEFEA